MNNYERGLLWLVASAFAFGVVVVSLVSIIIAIKNG